MPEEIKDVQFEVATREEVQAQILGGYGGALTPEAVAHAEAAVAMIPKIKAIALKVTNHQDWQKFGDKAYLNESGSKKLAALWGVSLSNGRITEIRTKDEAGNPLIKYSARVTASLRGRSVEEVGESDSNDDFFRYRWVDGSKIELPVDERDLTSIRKKSYTNALGRAIKALLGYGNVLWSEVMGNVLDSGKSAQVSFKKASPAQAQTVASAEAGNLKDKLHSCLMDLASGDENQAMALLEKYSAFQGDGGKTVIYKGSIATMKDGWAGKTYAKVKVDWEREFGGPQEEPGTNG